MREEEENDIIVIDQGTKFDLRRHRVAGALRRGLGAHLDNGGEWDLGLDPANEVLKHGRGGDRVEIAVEAENCANLVEHIRARG